MTFSDLGLSESLLKTLSDKGYVSPTPIQAQIIPLILRGSDVLACAPTGTGKTASFSLPLVEILSETASKARLIRCLILVPTRELATQVCDSFKDYTKNHKLRVAQFIGGASIVQQKQVLQKGVDVAIATPGRFLDLCETGNILPTEIKNVVIDEADRMMDMGFMPDLRKILGALPKMRQTVLLSATMPPAIKKLAQEFLMSPKEVMVEAPSTTSSNIQQYFVNIPALKSESERLRKQLDVMIAIFRKWSISSAVIFCNKKHHVDKIYVQMQKKKMAVEVIHGDLSQSRRNRSIENMKSGASQFLVASDVAARGIDISNMPCVINMD
ncbi:MAG: DEAD/DEAH box helicase, partial [Alphaproteobacteria bacterium]